MLLCPYCQTHVEFTLSGRCLKCYDDGKPRVDHGTLNLPKKLGAPKQRRKKPPPEKGNGEAVWAGYGL